MSYRVFAIAAHPDDIEFNMAGTLFLLQKAGCEIHYMNVADGSCGSEKYDAETIAAMRLEEAKKAAAHLNAVFHPPAGGDAEIYYEKELLVKIAAVMREVEPDMLLVPSPDDYMEDHMNTCRLAVSAAFYRGMRNYKTDPPLPPVYGDVVIYHAQPHGNRDYMNRMIKPDFFIDISSVIDKKTAMLAEHKSQQEWLQVSQGFNAYLQTMREISGEVGLMSGKFEFAEGWRRHNPLGLCAPDADPLAQLLEKYYMD